MIKCKDYEVMMVGNLNVLSVDFISIVHSFRKMLMQDMDRETAEIYMSDLGKFAFVDEDDKDIEKKFDDIVDHSIFRERRKDDE